MTAQVQPNDSWISAHYPMVRHTAWLLCGDSWTADDMAQETFLRALAQWHNFERRSSEKTWLYSILMRVDARRHRQLSRTRSRIRRWWQGRPQDACREADPAHQAAWRSWSDSLWAEVAKLPVKQQQALVLVFAQEMSYDEVAAIMRCPTGTAKSRVHHALKQLRVRMDPKAESHFPPKPLVPASTERGECL